MSKTPPNRRGITFEVGAQLEARDSLKNWYAGNIEKIDYEDEKVLIHYRQWSHRHDKWFDWTSPYLRPVEKIQLRRRHLPGFHVNDKVLASWSDCRSYPAKVLAVNKDGSYTVKFYDGVIRTVKGIHVKPFIKERRRQKSQSSDKNIEEHCERNKKPQDLGGCSSKRVPCNSSEQEAESETEEDGVTSEWEEGDCDEQSHEKMDAQSDGSREDGYKARLKEKRLIRKRRHEEHKLQMKEEREGIEEGERVMEPVGQHNYSKSFVKRERKVIKEEEEDGQNMIIEDELTMDLGDVTKTKKIKGEMEPKTQVESIKKEMQLFSQGTPRHKTTQAQGMADKCIPDDSKPPSESPSEMANSCKGPLKALEQSEASRLSGDVKPAPPIKPVRKQGFHNPNRFSREPLYRVIKNQPPPVLSINLDHNPFKCSVQGCPKSFRKAKLLHYHMKYYHGDDRPLEEDLSPTSSIQTRSTEKQATTIFQNNPKRRRTVSASLHSGLQCPTHTLTSPRADRKSSSQLPERRRVSAPPAVDPHTHQQRPLLREKSKENQLDRGGPRTADKETERTSMEIACIKERGRLKEKKSNDLLCIKLKKRKKKKKAKSEYTGSENIDISLSSLQSKLSLPPKPPLSHKHAPEAPLCKPGQRQAGQIYVDDEESWTDWSTESCGWSEDEGGAETDTTPPLSCSSVAMGMQGQEIVRCVCEVEEEDDFMIQCEDCLCWQHGTCMGLLEEHVPDRYACYICRDPPGQRQSLRYWYDRDWLSNGYMYGLSFLEENYSQQNAKKIRTTHQLLGDVQHVEEVLNGLQLKMSVLQSQAHPDLRLWCQPWKLVDAALKLSRPGPGPVPSPVNAQEGLTRASSPSSTVQESYISSEHCYQKPQACYATLERHGGSEPEDGSRSAHYQQHYGQELHPTPAKSSSSSQLLDHSRVVDTAGWRQMDGAVESKGGVQPQQWQVNLLDHIEAVQDEVTHRMDFIERELDVLESWLDYTGELEPPEPLARLPQLKHRIKQLLTELGKVQQIALSCAT